ncbi:MAG: glycosyltransferase family 4 protein [Planctomycetota bacterium]
MSQPRILFLVSEDWYFWSHRAHVARAAQAAGYEVLVATRVSSCGERIEAAGFRLLPITVSRGAGNPFRELGTLRELVRLYRQHKPDIVHHVAVKNIFLGTLAARLARVPAVVNAFAGLGHLFTADGLKTRVMRGVLRTILRWTLNVPRMRVIVQNAEDGDELVQARIVRPEQVLLIRGAGVCTTAFAPQAPAAGPPVVLLAARMLWSKGVGQFVEAARRLRARGHNARFVLTGRVDEANPNHVPRAQLLQWRQENDVEWWDHQDDMPQVLATASIVCLPTFYGEGLPRVLLEAAACAKPLVTTDMRGCHDICRDGVNGFLIPPRDVDALTGSLEKLLVNPDLQRQLGDAGRAMVLREFSDDQVVNQTLGIYQSLLNDGGEAEVLLSRAA